MTRADELLDRLEHFGVKLGLERMRGVLAALGSPQAGLPVVLVAGTNGKGSTAALLASIVTAAGYRSGLFTSPHLERVEERLRIDGRSIDTVRLGTCLERVVSAAENEARAPVTYFEALTASSLCHFRDQAVDVAVLEVGMGGRLDATNVAEPVLSVITAVSYDHQRQLGETLTEIAGEKAGILRPGGRAVSAQRHEEARDALATAAAKAGAELEELESIVRLVERHELPGGGQALRLETTAGSYELETRLGGAHQADNVSLAVVAAERLAAAGWKRIDRRAIEEGVAACSWPGRLEWIPLEGHDLLLDAAHNPAGIDSLWRYLSHLDRPFDLLFGMLRAKVDPAVNRALWERAARVVLTTPPSDRALPPETLAETVAAGPVEIVPQPAAALAACLDRPSSGLTVVSGSIYLVGALRAELRSRFGRPPGTENLFVSAGSRAG